jgi:hypothetical protein
LELLGRPLGASLVLCNGERDFMRFLSHEKYQIQTNHSKRDVLEILDKNVETKAGPLDLMTGMNFQGVYDETSFQISRIVNYASTPLPYMNSFLPRIHGIVEYRDDKAMITIEMSLRPFVRWFLIVFFAFDFVLLGLFLFFIDQIGFGIAAPLFLLAFGFGLSSISFWSEARKARELLDSIFEKRKGNIG